MQHALDIRTAKQAAIIALIGPAPVLEFREGAMPMSCALHSTGTIVARGALPDVWARALDGELLMAGSWSMLAVSAGIIGHFRIYPARSAQCKIQGSVAVLAGGADMSVNMTNVKPGQLITVQQFISIAGNA